MPPSGMGPGPMPPPGVGMPPPGGMPPMAPRPAPAGPPPGYNRYDEPTFGGAQGGPPPYEDLPGRRGKSDMTTEIRMQEPAFGGGMPSAGMPGPGPGGGLSGEAARIDQLRRTFQLRRFGSGYDRGQVDRLFDNLVG